MSTKHTSQQFQVVSHFYDQPKTSILDAENTYMIPISVSWMFMYDNVSILETEPRSICFKHLNLNIKRKMSIGFYSCLGLYNDHVPPTKY